MCLETTTRLFICSRYKYIYCFTSYCQFFNAVLPAFQFHCLNYSCRMTIFHVILIELAGYSMDASKLQTENDFKPNRMRNLATLHYFVHRICVVSQSCCSFISKLQIIAWRYLITKKSIFGLTKC